MKHLGLDRFLAIIPVLAFGISAMLHAQEPVVLLPSQALLHPPIPVSHQAASSESLPDGVRKQFLQSALFETAFIPRDSGAVGLGITNVNTEISFGLPTFFHRGKSIFTISPGFEVNYLDGPTRLDLPDQVYRASTRLTLRGLVTNRLSYEVSASPGLYSDLDVSSSEAFRLPGHAAVRYELQPKRFLYLGAAYLDREDITFVPVVGITWNPSPDVKVEALFPKPRIAWKAPWYDRLMPGRDHWSYLRGEFGGGSWKFDQPSGIDETLTIREFRLNFGLESLTQDQLDYRFEVGYVFNRTIELTQANVMLEPDNTVLFRASVAY